MKEKPAMLCRSEHPLPVHQLMPAYKSRVEFKEMPKKRMVKNLRLFTRNEQLLKKDSTSGSSVVPITGLVRKRETFHICRMIVSNRLNAKKVFLQSVRFDFFSQMIQQELICSMMMLTFLIGKSDLLSDLEQVRTASQHLFPLSCQKTK